MVTLNFNFDHPEYSDEQLNGSISNILNSNELFSMASINNGKSYINTAYYCFNKNLNFFYISDPATRHTENILKNSSVAIAIFDSNQNWEKTKKGLQLFGNCTKASGKNLVEGTALYLKRFTGLKQWIQHPDDFIRGAINTQMYIINVESLKLFDENTFGEEIFITLNIKETNN